MAPVAHMRPSHAFSRNGNAECIGCGCLTDIQPTLIRGEHRCICSWPGYDGDLFSDNTPHALFRYRTSRTERPEPNVRYSPTHLASPRKRGFRTLCAHHLSAR